MTAGKINLQKASGGITAITGVDGTGNTQLVLPESGTVATTASVKAEISTGSNLVTSPTGALGYGIGSGGIVAQLTSKSTSVTLNKPTGTIIMNNAALAAGASVQFTVNNSIVTNADNVVLTNNWGAAYSIRVVDINDGFFYVVVKNESAGSLSENVAFNFTIIKGATA